jgi:hypothetical protein
VIPCTPYLVRSLLQGRRSVWGLRASSCGSRPPLPPQAMTAPHSVVQLCSVGGCTNHRLRGGTRCAVHQQQDNRRRVAKGAAYGYWTAAWRRLRLEVLQRDLYRCRACGRRSGQLSVHLDPRLGGDHTRARFGTASPSVLVATVQSTHHERSASDGVSNLWNPLTTPLHTSREEIAPRGAA